MEAGARGYLEPLRQEVGESLLSTGPRTQREAQGTDGFEQLACSSSQRVASGRGGASSRAPSAKRINSYDRGEG